MTLRGEGSPVVVRCTGIERGERRLFKVLSDGIFGLFGHWEKPKGKSKGRSVYCPGENCRFPACRLNRVWRGYIAALEWMAKSDVWYPQMLEITEHCELDFRGIYQRGQLWELFRLKPTDGKNPPVQARFVNAGDRDQCPPAFDIGPTLRHLYHVEDLGKHIPNPMPPRTVVQLVNAPGPELPQRAEETAPEPMSLDMRHKLRQLANGFAMPSKNGGAH